jgi:hypothetical protein
MPTTKNTQNLNSLIDPRNEKVSVTIFKGGVTDVKNFSIYNGTLAKLFEKHVLTNDKNTIPVFVPGAIRTGGKRCDDDIELLNALVLDYDNLSDDQLQILRNHLKDLSLVIYTTHRHKVIPSISRIRIIILLSRKINKAEYRTIHKQVTEVISKQYSIFVDPSSRTPSQSYYLPSCPDYLQQHKFVIFQIGNVLDVELALRISKKDGKPNIQTLTSVDWKNENLNIVLHNCVAVRELHRIITKDPESKHFQRRTMGQLLMAIKMPIEQSITFFSKYKNFKPEKTSYQLRSLKAAPSCKSIAADHNICNGNCNKIKSIGGGSPVAFITTPKRRANG